MGEISSKNRNPFPSFLTHHLLKLAPFKTLQKPQSIPNFPEKQTDAMSSSFNTDDNGPIAASTDNFDSLLLSSLMRKLQMGPSTTPAAANNSASPRQSLEDILAELELELGDDDEDDEEDEDSSEELPEQRHRARVMKEERKLEQEIVKIIRSGKTQSLKANTGEAICINDHYVCITSREEKDSDYRVWEWHGHIMTYTEDGGFDPEYFYGNYFERLPGDVPLNLWYQKAGRNQQEEEEGEEEEEEEEAEEPPLDLGLRGLISGLNCTTEGRVLHRNVNADSQRLI